MKKSLKVLLVASTIVGMVSCSPKTKSSSLVSNDSIFSVDSRDSNSSNVSNISIEPNRAEGNIEEISDADIDEAFGKLDFELKHVDEFKAVVKALVKDAYNDEEKLKSAIASLTAFVYYIEGDDEEEIDYVEILEDFMEVSDYYSIGTVIKNFLTLVNSRDGIFYDACGISTIEDLQKVIEETSKLEDESIKNKALTYYTDILALANSKFNSNNVKVNISLTDEEYITLGKIIRKGYDAISTNFDLDGLVDLVSSLPFGRPIKKKKLRKNSEVLPEAPHFDTSDIVETKDDLVSFIRELDFTKEEINVLIKIALIGQSEDNINAEYKAEAVYVVSQLNERLALAKKLNELLLGKGEEISLIIKFITNTIDTIDEELIETVMGMKLSMESLNDPYSIVGVTMILSNILREVNATFTESELNKLNAFGKEFGIDYLETVGGIVEAVANVELTEETPFEDVATLAGDIMGMIMSSFENPFESVKHAFSNVDFDYNDHIYKIGDEVELDDLYNVYFYDNNYDEMDYELVSFASEGTETYGDKKATTVYNVGGEEVTVISYYSVLPTIPNWISYEVEDPTGDIFQDQDDVLYLPKGLENLQDKVNKLSLSSSDLYGEFEEIEFYNFDSSVEGEHIGFVNIPQKDLVFAQKYYVYNPSDLSISFKVLDGVYLRNDVPFNSSVTTIFYRNIEGLGEIAGANYYTSYRLDGIDISSVGEFTKEFSPEEGLDLVYKYKVVSTEDCGVRFSIYNYDNYVSKEKFHIIVYKTYTYNRTEIAGSHNEYTIDELLNEEIDGITMKFFTYDEDYNLVETEIDGSRLTGILMFYYNGEVISNLTVTIAESVN